MVSRYMPDLMRGEKLLGLRRQKIVAAQLHAGAAVQPRVLDLRRSRIGELNEALVLKPIGKKGETAPRSFGGLVQDTLEPRGSNELREDLARGRKAELDGPWRQLYSNAAR